MSPGLPQSLNPPLTASPQSIESIQQIHNTYNVRRHKSEYYRCGVGTQWCGERKATITVESTMKLLLATASARR